MNFQDGDSFRSGLDDRFGVQRLKNRGKVYLDKVQTDVDTFVSFIVSDNDQRIEIFEWDDEEYQAVLKFDVYVAWNEETQRCL